MTGLLILLALLAVTSLLMTVAIGGNAHLAAENRRLRRALAEARRPGLRVVGRDGGAA